MLLSNFVLAILRKGIHPFSFQCQLKFNGTRSMKMDFFFSLHLEGPQKMATYCLGSILNCHILAIIDILFLLPTTTQKMAPTTLHSLYLSLIPPNVFQ